MTKNTTEIFNNFIARELFGVIQNDQGGYNTGTQPQKVKSSTIKKEPQPFPMTDKGGKTMANKTLKKLIFDD